METSEGNLKQERLEQKQKTWWETFISTNNVYPVSLSALTKFEKDYRKSKDISSSIDAELEKIKKCLDGGTITGQKAEVIASEYKAVDYLYGKRNKISENEISANPLVDLLTLISNKGNYSSTEVPADLGIMYQIAIPGPPKKMERLGEYVGKDRPEQYAYINNKLGEKKEFRTLARFGEIQQTVIRVFDIFARVNDKYPEILKPTLTEYVETATKGEGEVAGMAVGLLELLFNADLIQDPRFTGLSESLRDITIGELGSVENIKNKYFYRVTHYNQFWMEGERKNREERSVLYGSEKTLPEPELSLSVSFPETKRWDSEIRKIAQDQKTISTLNPVNSIIKSVIIGNRTLDSLTSDLRESLRKRTELIALVRSQSKKLPSDLRKEWGSWLDVFSKERKTTASDTTAMEAAVRLIIRNFSSDTKLSRKSAGLSEAGEGSYQINPEVLVDDPLFNWIFALRDEKLAASLEKSASEYPEEFSLLLRLMTYDISNRFFRKKESKFILDRHYKEKADGESLTRVVQGIRDLVNRHKPDIKNIFLETLSAGDRQIADLMAKKRIEKIKNNLHSLIYEKPAPFVAIDKSLYMTRRAFLKTMLNTGLVVGLGGVYGTLLKDLAFPDTENAPPPPNQNVLNNNNERSLANFTERTPEALDPNEVKKIKSFFYGSLLNLPERHFSGAWGEDVGYFPSQWMEMGAMDYFTWNHDKTQFNGNVLIIDSITQYEFEYSSDELVVVPDKLTSPFIPPVGWRVSRVIQEPGAPPLTGSLGQIYYSSEFGEQPPLHSIMVMEKIPDSEKEELSSSLILIKGIEGYPMDFYFRPERAKRLSGLLEGDLVLKKLHVDFVDEIAQAGGNKETISSIGVKYSLLYEKYTKENRFYALGFEVTDIFSDDGNSSLIAIANSPDSGYYCMVASQSYRQFMTSVGFTVVDQPGFSYRNYDGQLWGRIAHQNSVVILPNRNVLYADMTPPVTDKTPKVDMEALSLKNPSKLAVKIQDDNETIFSLALKWGVGAGITTAALYGSYELGKIIKEKVSVNYVEKFLTETRSFSELEREVLVSTVNELAYLPYNAGFYDKATKALGVLNEFSPKKHGPAIAWLIANYTDILNENDSQAAFDKVSEHYRQNQRDLEQYFPGYNIGGAMKSSVRPADFDTAFEIARYLEKNRMEILKRDVYERLGVETGNDKAVLQAKYKADDIKEMVRERLFDDTFRLQHAIKKTSSPYYQALYNTLENISED